MRSDRRRVTEPAIALERFMAALVSAETAEGLSVGRDLRDNCLYYF